MSTLDIEVLIFPLGMIIVDIYIFSLFIYFKYIKNMIIMNTIYHILIKNKYIYLFLWPTSDLLPVERRSPVVGTWIWSYT